MTWGAIVSTVVAAGASAGIAYASQPDYVSPSKSSRKTVMASLKALPGQRRAEMAAKLGLPVEYETGKTKPIFESMAFEDAVASGLITQAQADQMKKAGWSEYKFKTGVEPETISADFTGYGDADIQGKLADQMARAQLELQQKYGTQFATEARKQAELADPQGAEARRLMADEINRMEDERLTRVRPVADALNQQMLGELESGRGVDAESQDAIARVLTRRGDTTLSGDDVSDELSAGLAGDQREAARMQKLLSYFGSGSAPADAAFRERQQSMANMADFLAGRTPQSQFQSLAGGQRGAAPNPQGGPLPNVPANLTSLGQGAGLAGLQAQVGGYNSQVSPYWAGLSALIKGGSAAGAAGLFGGQR